VNQLCGAKNQSQDTPLPVADASVDAGVAKGCNGAFVHAMGPVA